MTAACIPDEEYRVLNLIRNHEEYKEADLIIVIGMKEYGENPHFHIFRSRKDNFLWNKGCAICFLKNAFYIHGNHDVLLTEEEFNVVINKLKEIREGTENTYWKHMIHLWNVCHKDSLVDEDAEIFDYDYKTMGKEIEIKQPVKVSSFTL